MWEYKVIKDKGFDYLSIENELNELGKRGWEVVSVTSINGNGNTVWTCYTLKRKISSAE